MPSEILDRRLSPAWKRLSDAPPKVVSFDLFDTLIYRRVPDVSDKSYIVGLHFSMHGWLAPGVEPALFADARRTAEKVARERNERATGSREVRLSDIYAALPPGILCPAMSPQDAGEKEIQVEKKLVVADGDVCALAALARQKGCRVIYVTDTYSTRAELITLLDAAGVPENARPDTWYISNEHNTPKWRDLFDIVLREERVAPSQLLHIGDTPNADIRPAEARGLQTLLYDKWQFSERAQVHDWPDQSPLRHLMLDQHGDRGLTGLRSRVALRPTPDLPDSHATYWQIGAGVLGPSFWAYGRWVAEHIETAKRGLVVAPMREGRFLARLVEGSAKRRGQPLTVATPWASRRAVTMAAIFADDPSGLADAVTQAPGRDLKENLAALGLTDQLMGQVLSALSTVEAEALSQAIQSVPEAFKAVVDTSAIRRRHLMEHWQPILDQAGSAGLVLLDLGYAGTIQRGLTRIFRKEGYDGPIKGLYMALNEFALRAGADGHDMQALLDADSRFGFAAKVISRSPDVLEHAAMAPEGSLLEFDEGGEPVLLPVLRAEDQLAQMATVQAGILAFAEQADDIMPDDMPAVSQSPALRRHLAHQLVQAILRPSPEEAEALGHWVHEDNFNTSEARPLAALDLAQVPLEQSGFTTLADIPRAAGLWPPGALTRLSPVLGEAYAASFEGQFPPELLTSVGLTGAVRITVEAGTGDPIDSVATITTNAFGRAIAQTVIKPFGEDRGSQLTLAWPTVASVIELIDAALVIQSAEGQNILPLDVTKGSWSGVTALPGRTAVYSQGEALWTAPLPDVPAQAHAISLTLLYKYLRLEAL